MPETLRYFVRFEGRNGGGAVSVVTTSAREALDAALNVIADGGEVLITDSFDARYDLEALAAVAGAAGDGAAPIPTG